MLKLLSFYADIVRMCFGASLLRMFPRLGILGLSQQAWQILQEIVNSKSSSLSVMKGYEGYSEYFTLNLMPSNRDFWVSEEWLLFDDLANLERLGLIQQREHLDTSDKVYYVTRKGVRYARWLPTLPPKPPVTEEPSGGNEPPDFPDLPPPPPPLPDDHPGNQIPEDWLTSFSEGDQDATRIDSIEVIC